MTSEFLTVDEVASLLRVSKGTVYGWVYRQSIPFRHANKKLLFLKEEVIDWTNKPKKRAVKSKFREVQARIRSLTIELPNNRLSHLNKEKTYGGS